MKVPSECPEFVGKKGEETVSRYWPWEEIHLTRWFTISGVFAVTFLLLSACGSGGQGASEDEIVIGATVPMTGPLTLSGDQNRYALQLAQEDINANGGIDGKNLRIVFEDTQDSNSAAVNAFNKLYLDLEPPFMFLSSYSTQNVATSPEVAQAEIPVMYAGGSLAVTELDNPWMFRIRPNDALSAEAMAVFAVEDLNAEHPGILYIQNEFGQNAANVTKEVFKQKGVEIAGMESYGAEDKDMSAQIRSLRNQGADVLLGIVYPTDGALITKQIKDLNVDLPYVMSSGGFVPAALELVTPEELENTYGVLDTLLDTSRSEVADVSKRFEKRFDTALDPSYGAPYYDAMMIVAKGLEEVGTDDPEALRDYIANVQNYQGIAHVYTFDKNGEGVHAVTVVKAKPGTKELESVRTFLQPE